MRLLGLDGVALVLTLLVAGGVIVWLYLQKRPARRVMVPALELWAQALGDRASSAATARRVRTLPSLLLGLAIAAAVIFALSDPTRRVTASTTLLIIDRSASMGARDQRPTRLAHAKAEARRYIEQLPAGTRASVVALDRSAEPQGPFTSERARLVSAVDAITQGDNVGDLLPAAELALDLLGGDELAEVVLFSDGNLEHAVEARQKLASHPTHRLRHVVVGSSARNVAITDFALRRYPLDKTHQESLVALHNFGDAPEPLTLRIETAAGLLHEETLQLAPHERVQRTLRDLPSSGSTLTAQLRLARGSDDLGGDDRAQASLPSRPRTRVLFVSRGDRYLEAALLLDESLDVRELDPARYVDAAGFDVVIFDGVLPAAPPSCAALYLGPGSSEGALPLSRGAFVERPYFDRVHKEHPLLRELSWSDVNIARVPHLGLLPGDVALAESHSDAVRVPLLVEGERNGRPFLVLAFDLRESDLPLRAAFPLFVLRAVDRLAPSPGDTLAATASRARSALEGAIAPRPDILGAQSSKPRRDTPSRDELRAGWDALLGERSWPLLAWLSLGLLVLEWFTFHRRWTV